MTEPVVGTAPMLSEEYRLIHGGTDAFATLADYQARLLAADGPRQGALCLSGGGIRSGAFCLGVMQALAEHGYLGRFHYLSTVSGGGYTGAWLQRWRHWAGLEGVIAGLAAADPPPPLRELRNYTSFLTPQPGLASPDTWSGAVLWLRNVLINACIFLPALLALAAVPSLYEGVLRSVARGGAVVVGLAAHAALIAGIVSTALLLPSHAGMPTDRAQAARLVATRIVYPALAWAFLFPCLLLPEVSPAPQTAAADGGSGAGWGGGWHGPPLLGIATTASLLAGYLIAWGLAPNRSLFRTNLLAWIAAAAVAGLALWGGAAALIAGGSVGHAATLGPVLAIGVTMLASAVFIALRRETARSDLDREWLARLSAVKVKPVLLAAAFFALCLGVPQTRLALGGVWTHLSAAAGTLSGIAAALAGRSRGTSATADARLLSVGRLVTAGTFVAGAALFVALAVAARKITTGLGGGVPAQAALIVAAGATALALGRLIDVNRFSMHGTYRNRLSRAFLGSARQGQPNSTRRPDGFTGFAEDDNIPLASLNLGPSPVRLFPVIGAALNLTASGAIADSAAERKAAPWIFTPRRCGSESLARGRQYAATPEWGGPPHEGVSLATAMTISGAAVSPNRGYASSPATAFLMTLFDVRLGAWLPNPARLHGAALARSRPPNALVALTDEMLLRADATRATVYLSDGGHFDNLGIYEMIRRCCRLIVAVDADADPHYDYFDLGAAVRRIRIDFATDIAFDAPLAHDRGWALATITYPNGARGRLLYIKPTLPADVTADCLAYRRLDPAFPFDATIDQFFTESRFESYRVLGRNLARSMLAADAPAEVKTFLAALAA